MMEPSSSAAASGSRSGLPLTPTRKSGGWSSVQGSPVTSRGTKRSRTGLNTDRVTRSHAVSESDEEEDEEEEEDDVEGESSASCLDVYMPVSYLKFERLRSLEYT